jgi:hypothetical protein
MIVELLDPEGEDLKDLENSIKLHKALGFLTPLQARDHATMDAARPRRVLAVHAEAMEHRALAGQHRAGHRHSLLCRAESEPRAAAERDRENSGGIRGLTYDAERKNPYELTAVLLGQARTSPNKSWKGTWTRAAGYHWLP